MVECLVSLFVRSVVAKGPMDFGSTSKTWVVAEIRLYWFFRHETARAESAA